MATTLYPINPATEMGDTHLGALTSPTFSELPYKSRTSRGAGVVTESTTTAAGPTAGRPVGFDARGLGFISLPLAADVTIAGTITFNIRFSESDMMANVGPQVIVQVIRANVLGTNDSNTTETIVDSEHGTETGTAETTHNWTASPTSTVVNRGDRLKIIVLGNDAGGNMASGFSFTFYYSAASGGASGDSFVTFTEDISFETAPAETILYLTSTASDVDVGAAVEKEAWTSRGVLATTAVRNTAAGRTAPLQWTDSAGGNVIEWYTKPLQAFTLGGMAKANLRLHESNGAANASARCQIAVVDGDGANPVVWADWCIAPLDSANHSAEIAPTTEAARTVWASGDDLAVTNGKRLRIRVYVDDISNGALVTGHTVTLTYSGALADLTGDSWVQLPQSVSEFTGAAAEDPYPYVGGGYYPTQG